MFVSFLCFKEILLSNLTLYGVSAITIPVTGHLCKCYNDLKF